MTCNEVNNPIEKSKTSQFLAFAIYLNKFVILSMNEIHVAAGQSSGVYYIHSILLIHMSRSLYDRQAQNIHDLSTADIYAIQWMMNRFQ